MRAAHPHAPGERSPHPLQESRWPAIGTLAVAAVLAFCKPAWMSFIPDWILPAAWLLLLVLIAVTNPGKIDKTSRELRILGIIVAVLVAASALECTVTLAMDILSKGGHANTASALLAAAGIVWGLNIIAFSMLYWEFDSGGPAARANRTRKYPDFAFPPTTSPHLALPDWRPRFFDYLYLGFTNMTAFSPTDVMPLANWAKALMAVQAMMSLLIVLLVVSHAINIGP